MSKQFVLTKDGKENLEKELNKLINVDKAKVIDDLVSARAQGDLKENADYDAAKKKYDEIESRINEIKNILLNASIVVDSSSDVISIGSKVTVKSENKKNNDVYLIVGTVEADPMNNKISNESPLGSALIGHKVNDVVKVSIRDNSYNVKIINVENKC